MASWALEAFKADKVKLEIKHTTATATETREIEASLLTRASVPHLQIDSLTVDFKDELRVRARGYVLPH